jgi:hypothetical protein
MMNGRNLLIIGDSLSEEYYTTSLSALWSELLVPKSINGSKQDISDGFNPNPLDYENDRISTFKKCSSFCPEVAPACESPVSISCGSYPSFQLSLSWTPDLRHVTNTGAESNWIQAIRKENPGLVIMNTGAHFEKTSIVLSYLEKSLDFLEETFPNVSIVYRTASSGHNNCGSTFNNPPLKVQPNVSDLYVPNKEYHWNEILGQDKAIMQLIRVKYPRVLIVDIYNSTILRSDSHSVRNGDCLHYCIPGPIDNWLLLIYNALLRALGNVVYESDTKPLADSSPSLRSNHYSSSSIYLSSTFSPVRNFPIEVSRSNIPDFSIVKEYSRPSCYYVVNGTKHQIPNWDTLLSLGKGHGDIVKVGQSDLYSLKIGKPVKAV